MDITVSTGRPGFLLMIWLSRCPTPSNRMQEKACGGTLSVSRAEYPWRKEQDPQRELNQYTLSHTGRGSDRPLEEVDHFTYLGSVVDTQGGTEADVKAMLVKARMAFLQLKNIWNSDVLSLKNKIRIFNTNVKAVLLYGAET